MARGLPPLNALRAFEAAGRHLSFTAAAEELHVTPAAISHQVKGLEEALGVQLFRRLPRGLSLTDAGQACLPKLSEGFESLVDAVERARGHEEAGVLNVSVLQSLTLKWLIPRLPRFHADHPEVDVRVHSSIRLVDFAREEYDLAIRYGLGHWPGARAERLMTEQVFPVCSPALMDGPHPLRGPEDLRFHTLIHDASFGEIFGGNFPDWRAWLEAAGTEGIDATHGPGLSPSGMVIEAALRGDGIALGRSVLVHDDLTAGRLVRPFAVSLPVPYAYYVVTTETTATKPKVATFCAWLKAEARAMCEQMGSG